MILEYRDALEIFNARLKMKHLLKGTGHRSLPLSELRQILESEIKELDDEVHDLNQIKIIEESCDVMICAMLIIDRVIHPETGAKK